jgi:hypothetical protein
MNISKVTYGGLLAVPPKVMIDKIYRIEEEILQMDQVDCPVKHTFTPGVYAREMTIPPWTILTGAVHKTEHLCIISKGKIEVLTENGMTVIEAPCTFVSKPGIKRVGRTFDTEVIWTTIHDNPDNGMDMDVIVERISTSKNCELLGNRTALKEDKKCHLE